MSSSCSRLVQVGAVGVAVVMGVAGMRLVPLMNGKQTGKRSVAPDPSLFPRHFQNAQGLWLYTTSWEVPKPRALVFICHGLGEHMGRYEHVAAVLNAVGFSVFGMDHQGHGQSGGEAGYVEDVEHFAADYLQFVAQVQERAEEKRDGGSRPPSFLLGHSMGGLIAVLVANRSPSAKIEPWAGVVLSSPAIRPHPDVASPTLVKIGNFLSRFIPRMTVQQLDATAVSRTQAVVDQYVADKLVYSGGIKARLGSELFKGMEEVERTMGSFTLPVFIVHGTSDRLVHVGGSQAFFEGVKSKDKAIKLYEGGYHELFNEPERDAAFSDVVAWLTKRSS